MFKAFLIAALTCLLPTVCAADALLEAIRSGDSGRLAEAIEDRNDLDAPRGPFRLTILSLAAIRGDLAAVETLLAAGADPNAQGHRGMNALSAAVRSCRADKAVIAALLEAGADLEDRSGAGLTPLMAAIQEERTEIALQLIAAGADVNTLNDYGDGVLNYAIYTKNTAVLQSALDRAARPDQLRRLFTTSIYYYPGFGAARPHAANCG